ncbi:MAG: hypothetical protein OXF02_04315 [Simkaniaceae bacterium]|nr:hypothetical protein [Simkaniaceae bacterium]
MVCCVLKIRNGPCVAGVAISGIVASVAPAFAVRCATHSFTRVVRFFGGGFATFCLYTVIRGRSQNHAEGTVRMTHTQEEKRLLEQAKRLSEYYDVQMQCVYEDMEDVRNCLPHTGENR